MIWVVKLVRVGAVFAASLLLLTGCAPSAKTYNTVTELRDDFVAAGGSCPDFSVETGGPAKESSDCSYASSIMVFSSTVQRDAFIDGRKELEAVIPFNMLIGPNWVIDGTDVDLKAIQSKLGGEMLVSPGQPG